MAQKGCQAFPYLSYTAGITTLTHILFVLSPPPLSSLNSTMHGSLICLMAGCARATWPPLCQAIRRVASSTCVSRLLHGHGVVALHAFSLNLPASHEAVPPHAGATLKWLWRWAFTRGIRHLEVPKNLSPSALGQEDLQLKKPPST